MSQTLGRREARERVVGGLAGRGPVTAAVEEGWGAGAAAREEERGRMREGGSARKDWGVTQSKRARGGETWTDALADKCGWGA